MVFGEILAESTPDVLSAQGAIEIKESCDHCFPFPSSRFEPVRLVPGSAGLKSHARQAKGGVVLAGAARP